MEQFCDLVMEGGGVKGIALVGAVDALRDAGYRFKRVAGTSAGAIVGSLVAAGMPGDELATLMRQVDYRKFQDESLVDRLPLGKAMSLLAEGGVYEGDYLQNWLGEQLAQCGVRTFDDLSYDDPGLELTASQRFRLVVMVSDVSHGRLSRLPWDYQTYYARDPGHQMVADAVRASMSIPFFYEPVRITGSDRKESVLVDGGMLSNFPIDVFDRGNGAPRWPTFGLKLSARPGSQRVRFAVRDTLSMTRAMIGTMASSHDQMHIDEPSVIDRTIFIDTFGVSSTDFNLDRATAENLYRNGRDATAKFLDAWDWDAYKSRHLTSPASAASGARS